MAVSAKKKTWGPCARCGNPNGPMRGHAATPERHNAEKFGFTGGKVCRDCLHTLAQAAKKGTPGAVRVYHVRRKAVWE